MSHQIDLRFTFDINGMELDVVEFRLEEGLCDLYRLDLELASSNPAIDFAKVLDQTALLTIWQGTQPVRYVHGLVSEFSQGTTGFRRTRYRAAVEPQLARTALCSDWRVFQQKSVPEIIQFILKTHGITDYDKVITQSHHVPREYCVQADETDLTFLDRLAAEEGFFYAFSHSPQGHRLIHGDRLYVHGAITGGAVLYNHQPGGAQQEPALRRFEYQEKVRTSRQVQRDYTFKQPRYEQHQEREASELEHQDEYERYDYPGRYKTDQSGKPFTNTRLLALRRDARTARVEGDDPRLLPGLAFDLSGHPRADMNRGWRTVSMVHSGKQYTSQQEESADAQQSTHYSYVAELIPDHIEWRPASPPKPRIDGPLIATVVGPAGEEIFCDEFSRVKIQYPWDREGKHDDHSSCWVRVSQNWAGQNWGHMAIPRIGHEVIVSHLNGDPDQPIITGRAYPATQPTPYKLPHFKTLTTIKSHEHKGARANELRIDDTTGEISAALMSDHAASALNLGYLTHPRPSGGKPRGEGFELRTDRHGAVRAAAGLLLTTEPRHHASQHHKDLKETALRLDVAENQQDGFGIMAREVQAQESGDQDTVAKALKAQNKGILRDAPGRAEANDYPEFEDPHLVLASPAGIASSTPGSTHIASGKHLALSSTEHTSLSIGNRLLASASRGMRLFVQNMGWRLVAAAGNIDIRALKDSINLLAKLDITQTADRITITAKTELVINGGGSATVYNAGGITHQTTGQYKAHAADFSYSGPKSRAARFPAPPKPGKGELELFNNYTANRRAVQGGSFQVEDALGKIFKGNLDASGHALVAGAAPGPARVTFGMDPADTWSEGSFIGTQDWPHTPPNAASEQTKTLIAQALQAAPKEGPGQWVTIDNDYHGTQNLGVMLINRLTSMGDEGRLFGSDGKDYMNTTRDKIQEWQPLPGDANKWATDNSATHSYGETRKIKQRYLEGDDPLRVEGRSWHWQPVTADQVFEPKEKP
ncbi:type VI secretion system tip protein VgrG [Pseudomonas sp. TNT2022 ID357]|uniref:Type VI secretion system tip protein VgrG n=1 Tax=Pseudomonas idahonensis TaxID=2942628 RepID=A0ABT5QBU2_9PSED|nr:type VI secretion system Vgr family protein [Pseudomonas idahonensis]MDD1151682.1 type VI secretion system tip protein VgrG [Pseudomonas idahonensis]